jgi:hypothetical protein
VVGGTTYASTVSETATGTDAISAALAGVVYAVTITETATGTDEVSSSGTFFTSVLESATAADSFAVIVTLNAATAETATATDIAEAVKFTLYTASVDEQASAVDVLVVAPSTFGVSVAEVAAALDALGTRAVYRAQFVDSVTALDEVLGRYLWNPIDDSQTPNWQNVNNTQTLTWTNIDDSQTPGWTPVNT